MAKRKQDQEPEVASADSKTLEPEVNLETSASEPDSLAAEAEAAPEVNPADTVKRAYELMIGRISGDFDDWDNLTDSTRGAFKARFAQVQALPIFEQCCAELLFTSDLPEKYQIE